MASAVIKDVLRRTETNPSLIEDVMIGCAYPEGEQGLNIGRIATYLSGLPDTVPGMTTNRLCGSSMQSIHDAAGAIASGVGELFLCGGVESMSLVKRGGWNRDLHPGLENEFPQAYINMGMTAENLAISHSINREEQEYFALQSHNKASIARDSGLLTAELVPINNGEQTIEQDGCIRAGGVAEEGSDGVVACAACEHTACTA